MVAGSALSRAQNGPPNRTAGVGYKVGTITIKFVGTANVNEQVVRANMQLHEGGDLDDTMLDRDIRNLYSAKDLRAGFIETRDRRGALNRFPIITLSMAIVSNDRGQLSNYAQVGEAAAELKRYAKSIAGSVYVKDKRRQ